MKKRKHFFKIISALILLFAVINEIEAQEPLTSWTTISTVNNVSVSYQIYDCQGKTKMYLKIENNNLTPKTVSWSFWGSSTFENTTLNAEETKTGSCNINSPKELIGQIPPGQTMENLNAIINVN